MLLARREERLRALAEELGAEYEVCDVARREDVERVAAAVTERRSDVVNIVSVAGTVAFAPAGPYSASKHAQLAFSRAATAELRSRGVHVHTVNPGFVETEGFPQATVLRSALMRRLVVGPEHVARHVLKVIERDKRETFVPRWYRLAAVAQALAPGLVARISARAGYR